MRFLIFSDSHGRCRDMEQIIDLQPRLDGIFHLGDGRRDLLEGIPKARSFPIFAAVGNCDREQDRPYEIVELGGIRILYTHGHLQYVKYSLDQLIRTAREETASIALFGHTHQPCLRYEDGLYLLNPGSIGKDPSAPYASLDVQNGQILPALHKFHAVP